MKVKLILLSSLLVASIIVHAQKLPVDSETNKVTYSEVVEIAGINKNDLYIRAHTWFAKTYGSSKAVLEIQDNTNGSLLGKALTDVSFRNPPLGNMYGGNVHYTISILVKDGRYKYSITDFHHDGGTDERIHTGGGLENEKKPKGIGFPSQKQWDQIRTEVDEKMRSLTVSLKQGMNKKDTDF